MIMITVYILVHVVLVALKNREVRVYKEKFLVNTITLEVRPSGSTCTITIYP